jgi:hypothetical protein
MVKSTMSDVRIMNSKFVATKSGLELLQTDQFSEGGTKVEAGKGAGSSLIAFTLPISSNLLKYLK